MKPHKLYKDDGRRLDREKNMRLYTFLVCGRNDGHAVYAGKPFEYMYHYLLRNFGLQPV